MTRTPHDSNSNSPLPNAMERAQDLVIARATIGLSPAEGEELRDLLEISGPEEARSLEAAVEATRNAVFADAPDEALPAGMSLCP